MVQTFYKHLLGWPVTFQDLENLDPEYYKSIKALMEMDDVEYACLDFTTNEDMMGTHKTIDLIPDGANVDVTNENIVRYLEAILNYRLVGRFREQLRELSLGFTDVVPPSLLTIFDYQELELLLCGLPTIDMNDWMDNTSYTGLFKTEKDTVIAWFWETVIEMEEEKKARLLQFATGSSGVPPNGFAFLKGKCFLNSIEQKKYKDNDLTDCLFLKSQVMMAGYQPSRFMEFQSKLVCIQERSKYFL